MKVPLSILCTLGALLATSCATPSGRPAAGAATASGSIKPYPLTTCIVTGNDLESMGGSLTTVHNGQEIKFCCRPCVKKFAAAPEKYLARLR